MRYIDYPTIESLKFMRKYVVEKLGDAEYVVGRKELALEDAVKEREELRRTLAHIDAEIKAKEAGEC